MKESNMTLEDIKQVVKFTNLVLYILAPIVASTLILLGLTATGVIFINLDILSITLVTCGILLVAANLYNEYALFKLSEINNDKRKSRATTTTRKRSTSRGTTKKSVSSTK